MWKFVALAIVTTATSTALAAESPRVAFNSIGKARVGMSVDTLTRAFGAPVVHVSPETEEEGCYYASIRGLAEGVSLMMLGGRLARVDVDEPGARTVSGAVVGMSEDEVNLLYHRRLVQEPHAYTGPEGHYLTLRSKDGRFGMRFETDGKVVTGYYAGTAAAIQYIEGCQ